MGATALQRALGSPSLAPRRVSLMQQRMAPCGDAVATLRQRWRQNDSPYRLYRRRAITSFAVKVMRGVKL
jgi:hypothetical protein